MRDDAVFHSSLQVQKTTSLLLYKILNKLYRNFRVVKNSTTCISMVFRFNFYSIRELKLVLVFEKLEKVTI
ncbi:hypothetical protein NIES267_66720 [Calothrix parasitica NIES-267]|uniref:Uncharacterized protein n=1 Tax=Calothrix parasitica NIES-267 TaxID=1973488 RepID=A0A1Z4M0X8_9CYAN|nr:hypothetical protein NIES267_66720 [Calothrix parasitica NIES-267]